MAEPEPRLLEPLQSIDEPGILANDKITRTLSTEVADLLGRGNNRGFPGAQPVSFVRRHLEELRQQELVYPLMNNVLYGCCDSANLRYVAIMSVRSPTASATCFI
jgi:hypothetical protein